MLRLIGSRGTLGAFSGNMTVLVAVVAAASTSASESSTASTSATTSKSASFTTISAISSTASASKTTSAESTTTTSSSSITSSATTRVGVGIVHLNFLAIDNLAIQFFDGLGSSFVVSHGH